MSKASSPKINYTGDSMKYQNYETIFERDVEALKSRAILLKHEKTGARIFLLSNDDDNKVFYIGFRTPPEDDTGIAHIMEHSVLCGSRKYPLKDPFVELAKGSLNTFLNAMTYPDKTVYPVASRNNKDFANLMDVYLDAVFHPAIYERPEIMRQEGWSYKIETEEDPVEYNGVVYNEMKGAFSSPESVLEREILRSLYPDTPYGVESGGDPEFIPDLTYEQFIDFHKRYYHPSNSFIYLYGDMDIEERLSFLNQEYLSQYDAIEIDSALPEQPAFEEISDLVIPYPISETEEETQNTYLAYNLVCGDNLDPKQYYAMQMIQYALVENQGAPIRDRLLKEGIGKDILSGYENGILQPYFNIVAKNADPEKKEDFVRIIREEYEKAAKEGLNTKSLTASLNSLEFKYKEADFGGYPKGLIYGLNILDSWLYQETQPLLHIDCTETFAFLREQIGKGYFEELIRKYLLNNPHASILSLIPEKGLTAKKEEATREKLDAFKSGLTKEEISKLIEDSKALAAFQEEEDSQEAIESIPLLERSDIRREIEPIKNDERSIEGIPVIFHDYYTNGIAYFGLLFDCNMIAPEKLPYLSLLKSIVSFVDTEKYSYSELNNEINIYTGGLSFESGIYRSRKDLEKVFILSDFSVRTLYGNLEKSFDLVEEILFASDYRDTSRLYEIIAELKSRIQMALNSAGHAMAALRATSYFSKSGYLREQINGIEFYRFVEKLEKEFEQRKDGLVQEIRSILSRIIDSSGLLVSFTGDEEGYQIFAQRFAQFKKKIDKLSAGGGEEKEPVKERRYAFLDEIHPEQKNEGFKTSAQIQYVAQAGEYTKDCLPVMGAMRVFRTIMSYEYLWFHIRVQGGAYGCMHSATPYGECIFMTYRDPHIGRSLEVFDKIPEYLESYEADERTMTKYVIGTMSTIDIPRTPAGKGSWDMNGYLADVTAEESQKMRDQVIDCRPEDIRALAPLIKNALAGGNICVVGNENKIEEEKDLFLTVSNLFE